MPKLREITVPLPAELHQFLKRKVEEDDYLDAADVVREALLEFKDLDEFRKHQRRRLRRQIGVGLDESRRGLSRPLNASTLRRIEAQGRKRLAGRRNGKK